MKRQKIKILLPICQENNEVVKVFMYVWYCTVSEKSPSHPLEIPENNKETYLTSRSGDPNIHSKALSFVWFYTRSGHRRPVFRRSSVDDSGWGTWNLTDQSRTTTSFSCFVFRFTFYKILFHILHYLLLLSIFVK